MPKHILVVDDDDLLRSFLCTVLREDGHRVEEARNGLDGLDKLSGLEADLVVTDLMMPGIKGDELMGRIRTLKPNLPVVLITAFGSIESAVAAVKAGAYHYLVKPFPMEQLRVTVENALR